MPMSFLRAFSLLAVLFGVTSVGLADDAALTQLKTESDAAKTQSTAAAAAHQEGAGKLRMLEQQLLKAKRELDLANKRLKEQQDALPKQQEALTKATEPKTAADKALEESTKGAAEATKGVEEAAKRAEEAAKTNDAKQIEEAKKAQDESKKTLEQKNKVVEEKKKALEGVTKPFADADAVVKKTNETIAAAQQTITTSNEAIAKLDPEVTALKGQVPQLEAASTAARQAYIAKQKGVEQHLKGMGQWVSFSQEVAPVFYQRCLACHNARMAKGRLNMENYAAIMKGGESGAAIEPGKTDSNLCQQIADGTMPQDADPLTAEQIALVNKWVQLGAQLDVGVEPTAALIRVIPKFTQPAAPEAYPVPVSVAAVAISPDGKLLATGGYHELLLWDMEQGTIVRRIGNVAERVHHIVFHPDNQRIVIAAGTPGQVGEAKVFQIADGKLLADLVTTEDSVFGVALSPDGNRLATCGADRTVHIFDVATWKEEVLIEDHADWVMDVAWSPDGKRIATASRDKTSKVFDSKTGDGVATFSAHSEAVYTVGFLADNEHVISGGSDKQLRVWKIADSKQARNMGLGGEVLRLRILPDNRVVCASADKTARLYNAADGKQLKNFQGSKDWLYTVDFHPATNKVVTGSFDGEIRLWNAESEKVEKSWTGSPGIAAPQTAAK